jgi:hypothetical protein
VNEYISERGERVREYVERALETIHNELFDNRRDEDHDDEDDVGDEVGDDES